MSKRPAYVSGAFGGKCKNFPPRDTLMLEYQVRWIRDQSRLKFCEKSRQIGWTWATAYEIVTTLSAADAAWDEWISSRDEIQARLFLEDCKAFARLLQIGAEDLGEKVIDDQGHSAQVLQFASGKRAHSMSSNPDAQAGKRGTRRIDEYALHRDQRKMWAIAYPGITWGGTLSAWSTHRGSATFFNEIITEIREKGNPKKISLHRITLQDALDAGFLYKLQLKLPQSDQRQQMDETDYFNFIRAGCADEESFLQEYMCVPADDASAFLSYELITSCEYGASESWQHELAALKGQLYVGVDVGRDHDLTVIWILERLGDVYYTRRVIELARKTFEAQEAELYAILRLKNVRRCCIDCTGIGRQFTERAQKRFGRYKVEAIHFTAPVKEELAYPLRSTFEDRRVRIPGRGEIRADLRAIKKETTTSGNVRFTADRGKNGHSDRFWALALALHAGKTPGSLFLPSSFDRSRSAGGPGGRESRFAMSRNREVLG